MQATHIVTHGGETRTVGPADYQAVMDELVGRYPVETHGTPKVEKIAGSEGIAQAADLVLVAVREPNKTDEPIVAVTLKDREPVRGQTIDTAGQLRSLQDEALAKANGFAPAQTLYARGTMVLDIGVENARASRVEHEKKPLVEDACRDLIRQIRAENRSDEIATRQMLRMNRDGRLVEMAEGKVKPFGPMSATAFGSLLALTGIGGQAYLNRVPARLRSVNVNNWLASLDGLPEQKGNLKCRTRDGKSGREVFAVTSENYTSFDADRVAALVGTALEGSGARGVVHYDGQRTRIEALYHSNVQPEDYVAGEFFKAGFIIRTDDTGNGSLNVSACLEQNLCLNLIIIDRAEQKIDLIRHIGKPEKMAENFIEALTVAQDKVAAFVKQWGYACHDSLLTQASHYIDTGAMSIEEVLPGFFNGVIEYDLVPVRGKRETVVTQLLEMHAKDQSGAVKTAPATRASVVNAFTRWAHEVNEDPFFGDEVSRAAARLATARDRMPYTPIEMGA